MDRKFGKQQIKDIFQCDSPQNGELGVDKKNIVLYVEKIEPCLKFWVGALRFEKKNSAASRKSLNVLVLSNGNAEVRLETYANLEKKDPDRADKLRKMPPLVLYIEVMDIEDVESRLKDFDVIIPRRKTFYGIDEIFFCCPGGHFIGFAQKSHRDTFS